MLRLVNIYNMTSIITSKSLNYDSQQYIYPVYRRPPYNTRHHNNFPIPNLHLPYAPSFISESYLKADHQR